MLCELMGRSGVAPMVFNCSAPDTGNMEILAEHGSEEQQERWLQPLLDGEIRSCFSMTEPNTSGSDPTQLVSRAELDGDEWVINGHKWFTSGYNGAAVAIAMVVTDPDAPPHKRASMILVPLDAPGFTGIRPVPVMGHDEGPGHWEVRYEDCRVPAANLLGERGAGFAIAQDRLGPGRIHHCMRAIGSAERAFELMCRRAHERESFGGTLAEKQFVQDFVATSRMEIDAARLVVLHAAWKMDTEGKRAARQEISMIKVVAAQMHQRVLDRAMQVHGALGMSDDIPLAAMWRQGRWLRIADGPDEVHKMVIALPRVEPLQATRACGGLTDMSTPTIGARRPRPQRRAARLRRGDPRLRRTRALGARRGRRTPTRSPRAWASWAGTACRSTRNTAARAAASSMPTLFLEETARNEIPVAGYGVTLIVVGALNRFGSEEQKADLLAARDRGRHAGDRDVRARGRLGRGGAQDARPPRRGRMGHRRREDVVLVRAQGQPRAGRLPHRRGRAPRGHVDDPRAARDRGLHDHADPDARRRGDQRAAPRRRARARGGAARHRGRRLGAADGRAQLRAHDPGGDLRSVWPSAPSTTRSPTPRSGSQFGRPIGSFQALSHKFAELATQIAQVRLLVRWVAGLTDEDPDRMLPQEASMAKLAATELAKRCALEGMQIMGGYGYAKEYPMERHLRTAVVRHDLRRHLGDPEEHHRQDARSLASSSADPRR